jgi:hypothetical protein
MLQEARPIISKFCPKTSLWFAVPQDESCFEKFIAVQKEKAGQACFFFENIN